MAKSVLELAVGTGQWDAGLKKAKSALDNFTQSQGGLQQALAKDSENMRKFVGMMGQMDSSAKTAKGQMNDYKATIEQLTMQYNRMTEAQKQTIGQDYLQSIDQLKQKYQAVNEEIQEMNRSLNNVKAPDIADGVKVGGLFGGGKLDGMLQVFGGNLMTKGVELATSAVTSLISETGNMINQGVELAKQGEGIRIAFERLGRGDILQGLREATHGTVTDLELMKAAVKFNDFKLPLDELGTMLAFAQQKAKDTGQSVDYMVDSIVTGLGRKSLMILDNLGLSASEIKERMKETGDMTKAVGAIIRDQMAKSGDYVETAADRAAQADVQLKNAMEELGRTFQPLADAGTSMWTALETGALKFLTKIGAVIAQMTEAGRIAAQYGDMGGSDRVGSQISAYQNAKDKNSYRKAVLASYDAQIRQREKVLAGIDAWRSGDRSAASRAAFDKMEQYGVGRGDNAALRAQINALRKQRDEFSRGAVESTVSPITNPNGPKKETKKELTELQQNQQKINDLTQEYVKLGDESTEASRERQAEIQKEIALLEKRNGLLGLRAEQAQGRLLLGAGDFHRDGLSNNPGTLLSTPNTSVSGLMLDDKTMKAVNKQLEAMGKSNIKQLAEVGKETEKSWRGAAGAMSAAGSALQGLEDPGAKIAGIVGQAIANIALGFSQATAASSGGGVFGWIAAIAGGLTTMLSTISAIHSATGYAQGGIVDGRGGGFVGGMAYSGDNIGNVRLDSGELVLNRSQQNNLANALEGGNNNNVENRQPYVNGELIFLGLNNYLKRTGRGEIVVSKR